MSRQPASLRKIFQFCLEPGASQGQGREGFYSPEIAASVAVTLLKKMLLKSLKEDFCSSAAKTSSLSLQAGD